MKHAIYIAPGLNSCNVYWIPYPMRDNQRPADLAPQFQDQWVRIGQLNHELKLRYLDPAFSKHRDDIEGQMGGTYFEIDEIAPQPALS